MQLNNDSTSSAILSTTLTTFTVIVIFIVLRATYDSIRQKWSSITLVIIGGGPVGMISAIIGIKSGYVEKVILYEQKSRSQLFNQSHQIAIDETSVKFLKYIGVDFDNIEGCWQYGCFFTRIGVFLEYLLSLVQCSDVPTQICFKEKFNNQRLSALDSIEGRKVIMICDGSQGTAALLLGLSDDIIQESCHAHGAIAAINFQESCAVPAPEIRVHGIQFNLSAFNHSFNNHAHRFHLKLFGSRKQRLLALAVPSCETKLIKLFKGYKDKSMMRNIFQVCFNKFKLPNEDYLSEANALHYLKFSPKLYEIFLDHRKEGAIYVEEGDSFIVTEGEALRSLNIYTGMDINLAVHGLISLEQFLSMAAAANNNKRIKRALEFKHKQALTVSLKFIKHGMKQYIFTG